MENAIEWIGQKILLAFDGLEEPPAEIRKSISKIKPAGFTLFRSLNIGTRHQVRKLTGFLQELARDQGLPPFLICADQEGGQLMAIGDCTPLPGNMALGATHSPELAFKAGQVLGSELAALGINVNYAPCADVNINPNNPVIGIRSFGDDTKLVGILAGSVIKGIQSQGVAATVKHFPGHGDTHDDTHHKRSMLSHNLDRLKAVELPPFTDAIDAGVKMVMTAHLGIQALDGLHAPPATLSYRVITELLRQEMGFTGVIVSDAFDMGAIRQGDFLGEEGIKAVQAGIDLLLLTSDPKDHVRIFDSLIKAHRQGLLKEEAINASIARIIALKDWIAAHFHAPELHVIRSSEHLRVADEIAERSITLVRDRDHQLPLQLSPDKRIAVIVPEPQDLTPADTSSYVRPVLADEIRSFHPNTISLTTTLSPIRHQRDDLIAKLKQSDLIIAGTINACTTPNQAALIQQLIETNIPLIVIALRLPYDLEVFPQVSTYLCTYSILQPSMKAVAKALFGKVPIVGELPVLVRSI